jgi:putative aldouronate transport system substrate-binding protein
MTQQLTRRSFFTGAGALVGAAAFTACGGGSDKTTTSSGGGSGKANTGNVELTYQFLDTKPLPDVGLVQDAMNQHLKDLGKSFTVKLNPLDEDTFKTRMPLAFAAGNAGDVCYTAPWINNYYTNASQGDYLALDDLLPQYAPGLWKSFSEDTWNAARIGGKIYGVINQQIWPYSWGFMGRKDIMDKYGITADKITKYDDFTPYFKEIHAGESSMTVWLTDNTGHGAISNSTWDSIGYGLAVDPDDDNLKLFSTAATDFYADGCALLRKWHQAGYTAPNPPSGTDGTAAWNNGRIAFQSYQANGNGIPSFPIVEKSLQPLLLTTGSVTATLSAVNQATKYPQQAVEFLELLNTDKDFYNLICFGIEGKHYVFTDKALGVVGFPDGVTDTNDRYNPNTDWQFGNQFNAYYRSEADAKSKRWDVQKKMNADAKRSKALGFAPQVDSLKTEVTAVTAVIQQYGMSTSLGLVDPVSGIKTYLDKLKSAGIDEIQQTLQSQIDKWAEANK